MRRVWLLLVVSACYQPSFNDRTACGDHGECPSGRVCVQNACVAELPEQMSDAGVDALRGNDLTISGAATYDTVSHRLQVGGVVVPVETDLMSIGHENVNAIIVHDVSLSAGATLRATGAFPFAIVATGKIALEPGASIDVSDGGAGVLSSCASPPMAGSPDDSGGNDAPGGGGGGGGGYAARGGTGGAGSGNAVTGGAGGGSIGIPQGPRGGCSGAVGGAGGAAGGAGGRGGGAIYLVATTIALDTAQLDAGGGGGRGGAPIVFVGGASGGGGGGSGGMIWLEATQQLQASSSVLAANGGGGGGGGGSDGLGHDGDPGTLLSSPAHGGAGGTDASQGGQGGSRSAPTGGDVPPTALMAGGGGGGGVGYIHLVAPTLQVPNTTVTPDPT
jgi:hypothetical protein